MKGPASMGKQGLKLSSSARKALSVQLGEKAGAELATFIQALADRVEQLERTKVNVTPIAPSNSVNLLQTATDQLA